MCTQVLHGFALACRHAKLYAGGLLEPLYRLHATRLKMLLSGDVPLPLLCRHLFQPAENQQTASLSQSDVQVGDPWPLLH